MQINKPGVTSKLSERPQKQNPHFKEPEADDPNLRVIVNSAFIGTKLLALLSRIGLNRLDHSHTRENLIILVEVSTCGFEFRVHL